MKLRFGAVAAPLFLELGVGIAVGMLGTRFAAHISDAAGGAFALTNHLFGLLFMVFRLVGAGIGVVVSQNLGAKQFAEADRVARAALAAGTWMGGSMAVVALLFASPLLQLLNAPPDVLVLAVPLLQALSLFSWFNIKVSFRSYLKCLSNFSFNPLPNRRSDCWANSMSFCVPSGHCLILWRANACLTTR